MNYKKGKKKKKKLTGRRLIRLAYPQNIFMFITAVKLGYLLPLTKTRATTHSLAKFFLSWVKRRDSNAFFQKQTLEKRRRNGGKSKSIHSACSWHEAGRKSFWEGGWSSFCEITHTLTWVRRFRVCYTKHVFTLNLCFVNFNVLYDTTLAAPELRSTTAKDAYFYFYFIIPSNFYF